jgi:hypothetical protein
MLLVLLLALGASVFEIVGAGAILLLLRLLKKPVVASAAEPVTHQPPADGCPQRAAANYRRHHVGVLHAAWGCGLRTGQVRERIAKPSPVEGSLLAGHLAAHYCAYVSCSLESWFNVHVNSGSLQGAIMRPLALIDADAVLIRTVVVTDSGEASESSLGADA